ncbi:uncharacterized protein RB166_005886 isoform 1-T2 [Leptodactylus fuscus]|uniref:uncharacterized protein LOC142201331 n=1 Tax=Leptodactylus fuscus TaxID=238119 RepID=UPI003F4F1934
MAKKPACHRMDVNVSLLIEKVHSHPNLWEKSDPLYSDRKARDTAWINICQAIYAEWGTFSARKKTWTKNNVRKRWKLVRGRFMKEARKAMRSGSSPSKRKKFAHRDELQFILPSRGQCSTSGNFDEPQPESPTPQDGLQQRVDDDDHFDVFGYEVASTCRQMPPDRQQAFKAFIYAVAAEFLSSPALPELEYLITQFRQSIGLANGLVHSGPNHVYSRHFA